MKMKENVLKHPLLSNRAFLYSTEFFAGLAVMAVELGASRLLAPYFSSSQIVWTIIIGTIMIAMALGNLYGGKVADKDPNPKKLFIRLIIAGLWLAAIPVVSKYVIYAITKIFVATISNNFLIIASFMSCIVLFVFPLFILGTVTPSLVKYTVNDLSKNGTIVGRLYAFNTIGCIIGTFIPTFISIPLFGTAISFLIFSGVLLFVSIIYFVVEIVYLRPVKQSSIITLCLTVIMYLVFCVGVYFNGNIYSGDDAIYEGESVYNYLLVRDDEQKTTLSANMFFDVQSVHAKNSNFAGGYYDRALAAAYMADVQNKQSFDILILGNATGTYASLCQNFFGKDKVNIDGVEIDEKITDLGRKYFEMPEDINVYNYDGRAFLDVTEKKYDVILVDAYQSFSFPFQMSTAEFFAKIKQHLKDDGVVVANILFSGRDMGFQQYLSDTMSTSFRNVYSLRVGISSNTEIFASNNNNINEVFKKNIEQDNCSQLYKVMQDTLNNIKKHNFSGNILTDDKAPVELIDSKSLDRHLSNSINVKF